MAATEKTRLLLVEDNPADAILLKYMLAEEAADQFEVVHVGLIAEAVENLRSESFGAVLLDLSLPDSHGIETVAQVNSIAPHLPIVVMTGLDDEATAIEAVRQGSQDFLLKGHVDGGLLRRALRYAMERKQLDQQLKTLNETLEQRVAERTAMANRRAAQLQVLAAELTRTEQRERRRLAKVLHDDLQQLLYAARLSLGSLRNDGDGSLRKKVDRVDQLLDEAIARSRSLTVELSPPAIYETNLPGALQWLGRYMSETYGLTVEIRAEDCGGLLPDDLRVLFFEAARELLFNVVKHAGVQRATIVLTAAEGEVTLMVSDEGVGFAPQKDKATAGGFGLFSIRERLEILGGRMTMESAAGRGTHVTIAASLPRNETT